MWKSVVCRKPNSKLNATAVVNAAGVVRDSSDSKKAK